ncbi:MAG: hypothetical protein LBV69_05380 [Bacteroidales bacterium]|jgi:hypothetical protein|nr:hypothetical protein [Bacteroidales bacterium]
MKKLFILLFIATFVVAVSSCKKEGVYQPKQKISKIFNQSQGSSKNLNQRWTWDGKNLAKIQDGDGNLVATFSYDGKKLTKITGSDGETMTFTYDGKKITKVEGKYNGILFSTYDIKHNKSKISSITMTEYFIDANYKSTLTTIVFPQFASLIENRAKAGNIAKASSSYSITIDFTWDGDNISKEKYTEIEDGETDETEYTYKYDKKKNPLYNFFGGVEVNASCLSENNIISSEGIGAGYNTSTEFSIIYDGKYPIEIMQTQTYSDGDYTGHYTYTIFYEYEQ